MKETIVPVVIYLALLTGFGLIINGGSWSMIQGNGTKVYHAFVTPESISSEETLELITAPSSVVFMSNPMGHHAFVVNSKNSERMFCVVWNKKLAATRVLEPAPPGLTPYAL